MASDVRGRSRSCATAKTIGLRGVRYNEMRSLSLMSTLRINSGTYEFLSSSRNFEEFGISFAKGFGLAQPPAETVLGLCRHERLGNRVKALWLLWHAQKNRPMAYLTPAGWPPAN
jgi:hypothetical protein